jgi:tetrapyrrole methylase family protein/MazG family protein
VNKPQIIVVGLGPAGPELITNRTSELVGSTTPVYLRTARHPAAVGLDRADTFDDLYESADSFAQVYESIADRLVSISRDSGEVIYAVPGSPRVLEHSVSILLQRRDEADVLVEPAMSFLDLAWDRLEIDPIEDRVRLIDGHTFAQSAAGESGPLVVAHCHNRRVLSDIKLSVEDPGAMTATLLHHMGLPDEQVIEIAWSDLDRGLEPDHLTALYVPALPLAVGRAFSGFAVLVDRLRADCPWDAKQTHASLRKHLIEESYEVLEAIDALSAGIDNGPTDDEELDAAYESLCEELGDLLYQVFFHALLAAEQGRFGVAEVADGITAKLTERHPHVFGDVAVGDVDEVLSNWEASKLAEKGRASVMDGIPATLPAALLAAKVTTKARGVDIDPAALDLSELGDQEEIAAELFALIGRCVDADIDAESRFGQAANPLIDQVRAAGR